MGYISDFGTVCARRTGVLAALSLVTVALGGASAPGNLEASVSGLRSTKGQVLACLTRRADKLARCDRDPDARRMTIPASAKALHFTGLPSGEYALALIHDENANNKLDTFMGIPREGFGFSRNPAIGFGPPSFAAAQFTVTAGSIDEGVRVRYLL